MIIFIICLKLYHLYRICVLIYHFGLVLCVSHSSMESFLHRESQFNDLKHRVLKHVNSMPMRVDDFLKVHIESLNGNMKLMNSRMNSQTLEYDQVCMSEKLSNTYVKSPIYGPSFLDCDESPFIYPSTVFDQSSTQNELLLSNQYFQFPTLEDKYKLKKITEDVLIVTTNSECEVVAQMNLQTEQQNPKKNV